MRLFFEINMFNINLPFATNIFEKSHKCNYVVIEYAQKSYFIYLIEFNGEYSMQSMTIYIVKNVKNIFYEPPKF